MNDGFNSVGLLFCQVGGHLKKTNADSSFWVRQSTDKRQQRQEKLRKETFLNELEPPVHTPVIYNRT